MSPPAPRLTAVAPILSVEDLPAALDWYERVLDFTVAWRWGDPVELAGICRDAVELNLARRGTLGPAGPSQIYVRVNGVDAWWERLRRAGATIRVDIADRAYGLRDFGVEDASGNRLDFGEPLETAGTR